MTELWRGAPVIGYEVSSHGRVRSKPRVVHCKHGVDRSLPGKLRPPAVWGGYEAVTLSFAGKIRTWRVHVLVAIAFVDCPEEGLVVDHIDENKLNNHADNLRWIDRGENVRRSVSGDKHYRRQRNADVDNSQAKLL